MSTVRQPFIFILTLLVLMAANSVVWAEPWVLDNGQVRVEIDTDLFSIRYLGVPGGNNFLESEYVSVLERRSSQWLDKGGLVSDLVPLESHSPALQRGPADVVYLSELSVLLVGPEDPALGLRLEKEIALDKDAPRVHYTVRALSTRPEPLQIAIRNSARLPVGAMVCFPQANADRYALQGVTALEEVAVESEQHWTISMPPAKLRTKAQISTPGAAISVVAGGVVWHRQVSPIPPEDASPDTLPTVQCVLDPVQHRYALDVQSPLNRLEMGTPLSFTEIWTFEKSTPPAHSSTGAEF